MQTLFSEIYYSLYQWTINLEPMFLMKMGISIILVFSFSKIISQVTVFINNVNQVKNVLSKTV